ncbi:MAG: alkylation response protein AidB-like acyl-CoA dehydrogenase [Myxococcota bacterium]|jgi:alkylation response protein AidB-like acyl-CoA dehydrogenase
MFTLSDEHQQIRELARDFARNEIMPGATARDQSHQFPADLVAQLGEMGFMGMFIPEEYGGAGMDIFSYILALEEVCYADAGVGVIMSCQNSLVSWPILSFGTHQQKLKYLPPLASAEKMGCYALTEPEAGSDAGAQKTKITRDGDDYVLDGSKMWITNGPQADTIVTYASSDPSKKHRAVSAFILENTYDGYSVGKVEEKMGIKCSHTSALNFDSVRVPSENLLHTEDQGFTVAMATLDGGRIGIAAQGVGIAQRALDLAVDYAKQRETFGKPIARHQAIQWKIADMATRIEQARLLTWKAAHLKDQGASKEASHYCSMAKLAATETANFCAYEAIQIFGGYGYSQEYEVERLYRDARITTLYEGTSEIQRIVIAKGVLG